MTDADLLQQFASRRSEASLNAILERHLSLVYWSALRQVRNPVLAETLAQAIFIMLARRAGRLSSGTILPAWLFRATHHVASKALRSETRCRARAEDIWQRQNVSQDDGLWEQTAPVLDDAVARLRDTDRIAILLRYFQNKRLQDVSLALGLSEEAAQKRITRGTEKLRKLLRRRGVDIPAPVLPGLLMAHSAVAAPSYLGADITAAALGKSTLATSVFAFLQNPMRENVWHNGGRQVILTATLALLIVGIIHFWPPGPPHKRLASHKVKRSQPAQISTASLPSAPQEAQQVVTSLSIPPVTAQVAAAQPRPTPAIAIQPRSQTQIQAPPPPQPIIAQVDAPNPAPDLNETPLAGQALAIPVGSTAIPRQRLNNGRDATTQNALNALLLQGAGNQTAPSIMTPRNTLQKRKR